MNKKTASYVLLIVAVLACSPCMTSNGVITTANEMTNAANMVAFGNTQTVVAQQSQSTQVAEAVQGTLDATAASSDNQPADPGQDDTATGTVTGNLCFPSEGVPAVTIYAQSITDASWVSFDYPGGWGEYIFPDIPPGDYVFFAYVNDPGNNFAGGYTAYVTCGMDASCADHSLLAVHIDAGATADGIDICDWYGPEGFVPPRP